MSDGEVLRIPAFARYWSGDAAAMFGSTITVVAVDVLVVNVFEASESQAGVVRAVQFLPYLLVGLLAGALVDRWRRKGVLAATYALRGALLLAVPILWLTGHLTLWVLAVVLFVVGVNAVFGAAANQSFLPSIVPRRSLVAANARIGQSGTVATTTGPAIGGGLVSWIGAPFTILVDAVTSLVAAACVASIDVEEERPHRSGRPHLLREIGAGLRFTYRHPTLGPLAVSTHVWFVGNSMAVTVFALLALRDLGFSGLAYGTVLAVAGVGGFVGALLATRVGRFLGEGNTMLLGRVLTPVAWSLVAVVPDAGVSAVVLAGLAQACYGFSLGVEEPSEMGYWQAATPGHMLGRVNATRRSANRTMAVVGSLAGGVLAGAVGYRETLWIAVGVFVAAVAVIAFSPLRGARAD
ncbi:MFS transporter [Georgenia alba]|uniref:MFS transporter n=1 Tax=Georgenia alba TaxID=2233858 RepID=A0ABW2Q6X9_9MICO